ncbi:NMCC_0638 family (lipo)protein [Tsuneonella mangrovi]|uniref:NMCC_0638 family (lipo)protein n=1 Tax=Tsuneonella mangrovi TaxID=1982042 RepID=UPI0012373E61|nr:hypothetical protein [Tsuneonella mangrovi]
MKAFVGVCVTILGLFVFHSAATAAGITYDCDTAADHFSELNLPTVGVPFTVSGNVQLNALAGSKKYAAVARLQITSSAAPGHSPDVFAGFSISALPADPKKTPSGLPAIQMLSYNVNGKDDEIIPLSMMTKPGTVQPFTLSYDSKNVTVSLGKDTKSFRLKAVEPVVRIVCSTGEFLFTDLTIRSQGTAASSNSADEKLSRMAALYKELCLGAFPDDKAVEALLSTKNAQELTPEQVKITMRDDPARGWKLQDGTTTVWLEFPPYHACSVRWNAPQIGDLSSYRTIASNYEDALGGFYPTDPLDADQGDIHIHAVGEQRTLADKGSESLLFFAQSIHNEKRRAAGETGFSLRFVHQFAPPDRGVE